MACVSLVTCRPSRTAGVCRSPPAETHCARARSAAGTARTEIPAADNPSKGRYHVRPIGTPRAVKLSKIELAEVRTILEKIDRGLIQPRIPDRIGRFLRQYGSGRAHLDQILGERGVERRADAAVSGRVLGAVEVHPILEPEISVLGFPLGEVAETLTVSEELGGLVNAVMWLKGPIANAAYNLLRTNTGLRLRGDYRW